MKILVVAFILVISMSIPCTSDTFEQYKQQFGKTYQTDAQNQLRQNIFIQTCQRIQTHNAAGDSYIQAVNILSDMTEDQIKTRLRVNITEEVPILIAATPMIKASAPQAYNWGDYCALTPVKDQGECGSCWVFSSTAGAESFIKIRNGTDLDLSEQYVLDCTTGNSCDGGYPLSAMTLISKTGRKKFYLGIPTEAQYPYVASKTTSGKPDVAGICSASTLKMPTGTIPKFYTNVGTDTIKSLILKSPVVTYFWAQSSFYSYHAGVFKCSRAATSSDLNHGVLVFGYDKQGNYLIKNSWGISFGTNGFGTVSVSRDCGITLKVLQFDDSTSNTVLTAGSCNVYQSSVTTKWTWRITVILQIFFVIFLLL